MSLNEIIKEARDQMDIKVLGLAVESEEQLKAYAVKVAESVISGQVDDEKIDIIVSEAIESSTDEIDWSSVTSVVNTIVQESDVAKDEEEEEEKDVAKEEEGDEEECKECDKKDVKEGDEKEESDDESEEESDDKKEDNKEESDDDADEKEEEGDEKEEKEDE
jgi:hypothetical protein